MMRAFVALDLPDALRSALAMEQFLLPLPHKVPVGNLHLTLCFLGEVPPRQLEVAHEALADIRLPGFDLALRGLGLFGGDRPHSLHAQVVPNGALDRLARAVDRAARSAGLAPQARRFVPHVTLGRFRPLDPVQAGPLERAVIDRAGFAAGPVPIRDFVLYESRALGAGRRYDELARYPLG
ncbi:MAG: RNA 2',3'-cyclic phosphodiesterase [Rhodobacterales bacterium]|nr:RNA 2',3'-cyclic phosphodiesterase [Rhodobacterales bacterium]